MALGMMSGLGCSMHRCKVQETRAYEGHGGGGIAPLCGAGIYVAGFRRARHRAGGRAGGGGGEGGTGKLAQKGCCAPAST